MSEKKHTPGPWTVPHFARRHECDCGCEYVFANNDLNGAVASVHYSTEGHNQDHENPPLEEAIANAHLIAAAPQMYEALEAMLAADLYADGEGGYDFASSDTESGERAIAMARAALAAARGARHE